MSPVHSTLTAEPAIARITSNPAAVPTTPGWMHVQGWPGSAIVCTATVSRHTLLFGFHNKEALCDCAGGHTYGLILADIRKADPPIPYKGHQGIHYVPDAVFAGQEGLIR